MDNNILTTLNLSKGNTTTEFSIAKIGIGAGIGIQLFTEVLSALKSKDISTQNEAIISSISKGVQQTTQQGLTTTVGKNVTPQDIVKLADSIGSGNSYIGAVLALIMAVVYIVKRAILKYFELKGQIEVAVAQIQANTEAQIRSIKSQSVIQPLDKIDKKDIVVS